MITQEQLGHSFVYITISPGEITLTDIVTKRGYAISFLQFWADLENIYIVADKANYAFKKNKDGTRYILTRIVLVTTKQIDNTYMRLPGAEIYEL